MAETAFHPEENSTERQHLTMAELWGKVMFDSPEQKGEWSMDGVYELLKEQRREAGSQEEYERRVREQIIENGGEELLREYDEALLQLTSELMLRWKEQRRASDPDQMHQGSGIEKGPREN